MTDTAPPRPILALTLAAAGKRVVPDDARPDLTEALTLAFDALAARLSALGDMARRAGDPLGARFDEKTPARLTLVTGLADGVDQVAGAIFLDGGSAPRVERVLGAVLPCGREDFVANSKVEDRATFDAQLTRCAFVVELDGAMPASPLKPDPCGGGTAPPWARADAEITRERGEAFSGQSEVLLRQVDILLAVDNPRDDARVGGTRETIQGALEMGTPVILLHLGEAGFAVLRTRGDFDEPVMLPPGAAYQAVARLVDELIGVSRSAGEDAYVDALIAQFFAASPPPPRWLNRFWDRFEIWFKNAKGPFDYYRGRACAARAAAPRPATQPPAPSQRATPPSSSPESPYDSYKLRASQLSGYYAGQYRGAFLAAYALAVVAVAAAVLSLAIAPHNTGDAGDPWWQALMGLGVLKIWIVVGIFRLADRANKERLAHRAADYRYLSERLRAMTYLPKAACLRSPAPWSLPYTTRVAAQGVIDQLFAAIVRQAEPLKVLEGAREGQVVRPDAGAAMTAIREDWLIDQVDYHARNRKKLKAMSRWLEHLGRGVNGAVIAVAAADVLLLVVEGAHLLPSIYEPFLHDLLAPTLIAFAAVLPAAVASANGVRFQSECTRLADRSLQMAEELSRLEARSWIIRSRPIRIVDALHLATDTARLTLDEVAEWSAIYGKEFVEM